MCPEISVIVPVYNVENYVEKCIHSILEQTFSNFELIIVNDGSTDDSLERVKRFRDKRIVLIDQMNQGLSGARNTGLKVSKGKYVTFIDSDDWISKNYLKEMISCATKYNADIVSIKECTVTDGKKYSYIKRPLLVFRDKAADALFGLYNSNFACSKLIKKDIFIKNNISFPLHRNYEDLGTMYKVYDKAQTAVVADKENYFYLIRSGSITQSKNKEDIIGQIYFIQEIKKYKFSKQYSFFGLYMLVKIFSVISDLNKCPDITPSERSNFVHKLYSLSRSYKFKLKYLKAAHMSDQIRAILVKVKLANIALQLKNRVKK